MSEPMQDRLENIIRQRKDIIVEETHNMTDATPPTTKAFATGYIFAMQEVLVLLEKEKQEQMIASQTYGIFKKK
jgi:hypothetical protein